MAIAAQPPNAGRVTDAYFPVWIADRATMGASDYWDLLGGVGVTVTTVAAAGLALPDAVRLPLALLFVCVVPGYALIAAVFPTADEGTGIGRSPRNELDGVERLGLGVGFSVAGIGLLGLGLDWVAGTVALGPFLGVVSGATLLATLVAAGRRWRTPADRRYVPRVPAVGAPLDRNDELARGPEIAVTALLVVALAGAGGALFVGGVSGDATPTAVSLLAADGTASDYPTALAVGESATLRVGIENHEGERTPFTAVVFVQRIGADGEQTTIREVTRLSVTLDDREATQESVTVTPETTGDLQIVVAVYRGDAPSEPDPAAAFRSTQLTVTVESG